MGLAFSLLPCKSHGDYQCCGLTSCWGATGLSHRCYCMINADVVQLKKKKKNTRKGISELLMQRLLAPCFFRKLPFLVRKAVDSAVVRLSCSREKWSVCEQSQGNASVVVLTFSCRPRGERQRDHRGGNRVVSLQCSCCTCYGRFWDPSRLLWAELPPPDSHVEVLTLSVLQRDCIWRRASTVVQRWAPTLYDWGTYRKERLRHRQHL